MKKLLLILKYPKLYLEWRKRVKGQEIIDFKRGPGFYLVPLIDQRGSIERFEIKSGKTAICKLIDYRFFLDPDDMVKEAYYQILGYIEDGKMFDKMSFEEFYKTNIEVIQ